MKRSFMRPGCTKDKYLIAFLIGFGTMLFSLLPMMLTEQGYFIYYGDYNAQQIPFYCLANTTVRSGQFGWNWLTDLGSDFMTSYSFYLFGSPFFWITALLPRSLMLYAMPVILAIKHGVACLTAYAYIRRFVRGCNAALTGALLYSFSGFQIYNVFFNHFQDVTAFFPLMLIALEECVNNQRRGTFALITALMACINYYFFAGQAVFLVIYCLCRFKSPDFHITWRRFLLLVLEAVLGTLLAAFILLPSAMALMGNDRLNERLYGTDMISYADRTLIPYIIQSFFMPCNPPGYPILFSQNYEMWASVGGYLPLFSMTGVISFMQLRKKHWAAKLTAICILFSFVPVLNSLFQALNSYYYARWFYMPILIMAMMTAHTLDDEASDGFIGLKASAIILAFFALVGILPRKPESGEKPKLFSMPEDIPYFWITIAVAAVFLICAYHILQRKKNGTLSTAFMVFVTSAASIICIFTTTLYAASSVSSAEHYIDSFIDYEDEVYEAVDNNSFFRTDTGFNTENASMIWGLPSIRAFHSVVTPSIMDFYSFIGIRRDVASRPSLHHYGLRGLLSVKYFYKEKSSRNSYNSLVSEVPSVQARNVSNDPEEEDISNVIIPDELTGFEYAGETANFEIYQNKLFIPMGWAYDSYITQKEAKQKNAIQREVIMIKSLVLTDEQAEKYNDILTKFDSEYYPSINRKTYEFFCLQKQQCCAESFSYDENSFRSIIKLQQPQLVFFSVPYSSGWSAEVNGRKVDIERVNEGFMAVKADSGKNTIVFRYRTPYLIEGIIISICAAIALALFLILSRKKGSANDTFRFGHYYNYTSCEKIKTAQTYCESLFNKKEK
ncbi:MAG: YfhO family protein [Ruminococcus sp.]|nr:YfhO family protein [Ruminococcus sp.]